MSGAAKSGAAESVATEGATVAASEVATEPAADVASTEAATEPASGTRSAAADWAASASVGVEPAVTAFFEVSDTRCSRNARRDGNGSDSVKS